MTPELEGMREWEGALAGVRVVEFTAGMAGPWIGRFMAWCGAEVIKVESKDFPDVTRLYLPPRAPELGIQSQLSPWFTDWNAGKRFVALDLTMPEGVELARRIAACSDVLVENYSTGVLAKLGLGREELLRLKPDLITFSTTGYGDSGPNARYVTWGPNIEAISGLSAISGHPGRPCTMTQYAYPDPLSALHGLFAVLCALDHRARTGEGQHIGLSQLEASVSCLGHLMMEQLNNGHSPARLGNASLSASPQGCYRCLGEDRWCTLSVSGDEQWQRLAVLIGRPEWGQDARYATFEKRRAYQAELDAAIEAWTSERDPYEVMTLLQQAGIAAGVVQNAEDLYLRDRQLAERGFFEEIDHRVKGKVVATGIPLGLSETPGHTPGTGSAIGQDNDYVFGELLGLSAEELREQRDRGVIQE